MTSNRRRPLDRDLYRQTERVSMAIKLIDPRTGWMIRAAENALAAATYQVYMLTRDR